MADNRSIRIARDCYNVWVEDHENGTEWHGAGTENSMFLLFAMC